jgi:hypothetical protein
MRAGFSRVEITPPVGEHPEMMGFGPFLGRTALEVLQPLHLRASYLEAEEGGGLLLSFDLCGLREDLADSIRQAAGEAVGLRAEQVIACCTHTHSAPSVMPIVGWGEFHEPTARRLPRHAAEAAAAAKAAAAPVVVEGGVTALEGFSHNRVYGSAGPLDTRLQVLAFRSRRSKRLLGLWSHYSCHPVLLCEQCRVISPDFCGVAMQALEAKHRSAVCTFLQGSCGDVNPVLAHMKQERSIVHLAHFARRFRLAVEEALGRARPVNGDRVQAISRQGSLPVAVLSEAAIDGFVADAELGRRGEGWRRLAAISSEKLRAEAQWLGRQAQPRRRFPMAALAVGEQVLVCHPFEMFTRIGLDIRAGLGPDTTWVVGYANGYEGYAPTADRFTPTSGDYAAHGVPLMMARHPYRADLPRALRQALTRLAEEVKEAPPPRGLTPARGAHYNRSGRRVVARR